MLVRSYHPDDFPCIYALISEKFVQATTQLSDLPKIPAFKPETLQKHLPELLFVAEEQGTVIGYLGGYILERMQVIQNGFLAPLAWHGIRKGVSPSHVLFLLMQKLGESLLEQDVHDVAILVHAHAHETQRVLFEMGFGRWSLDLIRDLTPIDVEPLETIKISAVKSTDLPEMMPLFRGIQAALAAPPICLYDRDSEAMILADYEKVLTETGQGLFVAREHGKPIGYIKYTLNDINRAELDGGQTAGVNGAYVLETYRGRQIMEHLLNQVIFTVQAAGYTHLMTDCETANLPAVAFWMKYFKPYSYGMLRHLPYRPK